MAKDIEALARRVRVVAKDFLTGAADELAVYYNDHFGADIGAAAFRAGGDKTALSLRPPRNTGNKLRIVSGDLARAVSGKDERGAIFSVEVKGDQIVVESGVDPDIIKYARIHELGGTIKHPGGTPYRIVDGKAVFVRKEHGAGLRVTKPHDITIKARPYLKPGMEDFLRESLPRYVKRIMAALGGE